MITVPVSAFAIFLIHATYSAFTLYMMLILMRWAAPWLQIDLNQPRLRWVRLVTDPLLNRTRILLGRLRIPAEAFDLAPPAALLALWLARSMANACLKAVALAAFTRGGME